MRAILFILSLAILLLGCNSKGYFLKKEMVIQPSRAERKIVYNEYPMMPGNVNAFAIDDRQFRQSDYMGRMVTYRKGKLSSETLGMNDTMLYKNLYYYSGRIRLSFCINRRTNVIDGIAQIYNKKGLLDITAVYDSSVFKHVLYYRNAKALNRFMKGDKKIRFEMHSGKP